MHSPSSQLSPAKEKETTTTMTTTGMLLVADDFGMNRNRTDAILAARGVVSRTSLLVNGEDAARAATLGRRVGMHQGLHFNITEGYPVSNPGPSPSSDAGMMTRAMPMLTHSEGPQAGQFLGKTHMFMLLQKCCDETSDGSNVMMRAAMVESLCVELEAQLNRFVELTGEEEIWLDGHHHVHVLEPVWEAIEQTCFHQQRSEELEGRQARERRIRRWTVVGIRLPIDPTLSLLSGCTLPTSREGEEAYVAGRCTFREESDIYGLPFWCRVSELARLRRRRVPPHVCVPDVFAGFDIGGFDCSTESIAWKLRSVLSSSWCCDQAPSVWRPHRLPSPKECPMIVELMVHIGFDVDLRPSPPPDEEVRQQEEGPRLFIDDSKPLRQREWDVYNSAAFMDVLRLLQVTLLQREFVSRYSSS